MFLLQNQGSAQQLTSGPQYRAVNTFQLYTGSSMADQSGRWPAVRTASMWRQVVGEKELLCSPLTREVPLQCTPRQGTCLRATSGDLQAEQPAAPQGAPLPHAWLLSLGCKSYKCAMFLLWMGLPPAFIHCTLHVLSLPWLKTCLVTTSSNAGSLKFLKNIILLWKKRGAAGIRESSRKERLERKEMAVITGFGTQQGRAPRLRKRGKETRLDFHLRAHGSHYFAPQPCPVTKTKWWHGLSVHISLT